MDNLLIKFKEDLINFDSDEKRNLIEENCKLRKLIEQFQVKVVELQVIIDELNIKIEPLKQEIKTKEEDIKDIINDITDNNYLYVLVKTEVDETEEESYDTYDETIRYTTTYKENVTRIFPCYYLAEKYLTETEDEKILKIEKFKLI